VEGVSDVDAFDAAGLVFVVLLLQIDESGGGVVSFDGHDVCFVVQSAPQRTCRSSMASVIGSL